MLWESVAPAEGLDRIGFADLQDVEGWVRQVLLEYWDVGLATLQGLTISASNALAWIEAEGRRVVVKWSVDPAQFEHLGAVARLVAWLDSVDYPVSPPIPSNDGQLRVKTEAGSIELQAVQPGDLLNIGNSEQVFRAGQGLGILHGLLRGYPESGSLAPSNAPALGVSSLQGRLDRWLHSHDGIVPSDFKRCFERLEELLDDRSGWLKQPVHGDYRSANLLFLDTDLSAVLDFEEATVDLQVIDLARSSALLGTQFRGWLPPEPPVVHQFLSGYKSTGLLAEFETLALGPLILWQFLSGSTCGWNKAAWIQAAYWWAETER
jgi:homoserine kinase type II